MCAVSTLTFLLAISPASDLLRFDQATDNTFIDHSCVVHIPRGLVIEDASNNRIIHITVQFASRGPRDDEVAGLVPKPDVLLASLPLLEAQASSEIENIVTTADSLFRHLERTKSNDPAT
jgi:hypothetical protein